MAVASKLRTGQIQLERFQRLSEDLSSGTPQFHKTITQKEEGGGGQQDTILGVPVRDCLAR